MQSSTKLQRRGGYCKALCCSCSCRLSVSSSDNSEEQFPSISSLAHAMVQERLEQMIREARKEQVEESRTKRSKNKAKQRGGDQNHYHDQEGGDGGAGCSSSMAMDTKFIVVVAMEKSSYDPKEDFRESMVEMIMANRIGEPKDLRRLLNYYLSMNSDDYHATILEVFHEVCSNLFLRCKCH